MSQWTVAYTDPAWAVGEGGRLDPARADIEREVFGPEVELRLGALHDRLRGAHAVVIYRTQVTPELVTCLRPTCRVVARQGVGLDNLNAEILRQNGILAFNVPDYCVEEVSTHTLALLLALERHICVQDEHVKSDRWSIYTGGHPRRLSRLTAGVIGFGRIGRATGRKLQAFYGAVLAYDPHVPGDLMAGYGVSSREHLQDLLADSDAIVLHAWLDTSSRHLINRDSLSNVRPGALLVNTARGELVEPEAILEGLESGRLGGYGSDVFSPEDPNQHSGNRRLLGLSNVVVSAHRAFLSRESEQSLRRRVAEEIVHVLRTGEPPRFGRIA